VVAVAVLLAIAGCSETNVDVVDEPIDVGGDDTLPDGFVADNRPLNPATSFEMPCPLREMSDWGTNPYFTAGGLPESIKSIDEPTFIPIRSPNPLLLNEPVIVCEFEGQVRAFPIRVLIYHEIINMCWDTSQGPKYSFLTYCPLVDGGVHFVHPHECDDPRGTFGVSGGLFNGNLVMYDRKSIKGEVGKRDWYIQLYGGGILGTCTPVEPQITHMSWAMCRKLYPEGEVLSLDTGMEPQEGYEIFDHPYSYHWRVGDFFFPLDLDDDRGVDRMDRVFGVLTPDGAKAYLTPGVSYVRNEQVGSYDVVVWNDHRWRASAAFEPYVDGQKLAFSFLGRESHGLPLYVDDETGSYWTFDGIAVTGPLAGKRLPKLVGIRVFWFSWAAMFQDTELFVPEEQS
jgi:hypothetical protein